jgi:SAM-dependent methyltransferase
VSNQSERDPWYAHWFGEEYLALYPDRDDREAEHQAAFAADLLGPYALRGVAGFLDLACGTGRHAVVLADEARVTGLDLSIHLLAEAVQRFEGPPFVRGDMRALPFRNGVFGAVVNFFTSFGYFEEVSDDARVLTEIHRVLAPGGAFLSDFFNAERVIATLASREEKFIQGQRIVIRRSYDKTSRRVEKEIEMGIGAGRRVFRECVRAYREDELRQLHAAAGFQVVAAYGDFDGMPFELRRSPRLILLAVKPGSAEDLEATLR